MGVLQWVWANFAGRIAVLMVAVPLWALLGLGLYAARTMQAKYTAAGELVLRVAWPIRWFRGFALCMPGIVVAIMFLAPPGKKDLAPALGCVALFTVLGGGFHLMLRRLICIAGDAGILMPSIWTRPRFYTWPEVTRVEVNLGATAFLFYTADGRKWDIPRLLHGHPALLDLARRHVEAQRFADMGVAAPSALRIGIDPVGSMAQSVRITQEVARKRAAAGQGEPRA